MVITVNRNGNVLSGSNNGVPFSVPYSEKKHQAMKELAEKAKNYKTIEELRYYVSQFDILTRENYADFIETKSPYIKVNKDTNGFYLQYNGVISNRVMPDEFAQRILKAAEKSLDILPMVKCWVRFLHNPNYSDSKAKKFAWYINAPFVNKRRVEQLKKDNGLSEVMAIEWSTTPQVSITMEGLIVGYKSSLEITDRVSSTKMLPSAQRWAVDADTGLVKYDDATYDEDRVFEPAEMHGSGDAFYSGDYLGHIIRVGRIHYLERWDQVNCNDDSSSVPGLHLGGLHYIQGYQGAGTTTHNILVDPQHIGAVVGIGKGIDGAMRVKQYFVLNAFNGVNKTLYHSSRYAALTDKECGEMIQSAIKKDEPPLTELQ